MQNINKRQRPQVRRYTLRKHQECRGALVPPGLAWPTVTPKWPVVTECVHVLLLVFVRFVGLAYLILTITFMVYVLFPSLIYKWGNWSSENLSKFPKFSWLINGRVEIQIQEVSFQKLCSKLPYSMRDWWPKHRWTEHIRW